MDGQLDEHFMSLLESKNEKLRFVRVDSDIPERLIVKEDASKTNLSAVQSDILQGAFSAQLPEVKDANFIVALESLGENGAPAVIVQNEFMRRMKKMAEQQSGMGFMGVMPDNYNLVVNTDQPAVKKILETSSSSLDSEVSTILSEISALNEEVAKVRGDKDADEAAKKSAEENEKKVADLRKKQDELIGSYAAGTPLIRQIIDLALLQAGLLQGKELSDFISRSITLL